MVSVSHDNFVYLSLDYSYPYATLVISVLSTAVVLARNKVTVSSAMLGNLRYENSI